MHEFLKLCTSHYKYNSANYCQETDCYSKLYSYKVLYRIYWLILDWLCIAILKTGSIAFILLYCKHIHMYIYCTITTFSVIINNCWDCQHWNKHETLKLTATTRKVLETKLLKFHSFSNTFYISIITFVHHWYYYYYTPKNKELMHNIVTGLLYFLATFVVYKYFINICMMMVHG